MKRNKQNGQALIEYALLLIMILVIVIAAISLLDNSKSKDEQIVTDSTVSSFDIKVDNHLAYEYVVVHGMPCLHYRGASLESISCDWSQWEGSVDGDRVILHNKNP